MLGKITPIVPESTWRSGKPFDIHSMKNEYSLDAYRALIHFAQNKGYRISPFELNPLPQTIILRHDVDYSLRIALNLARVNAALGIRGTFFVLLRSQIYN